MKRWERSSEKGVIWEWCVCVFAGSISQNASAAWIYKNVLQCEHAALWKAAHLVFEIHEQTRQQKLRDISPPLWDLTCKHVRVCSLYVYILLMIQRSKALVTFCRGVSKLAGVFAPGQAATLWWETPSSEGKPMIQIHFWATAYDMPKTLVTLFWTLVLEILHMCSWSGGCLF